MLTKEQREQRTATIRQITMLKAKLHKTDYKAIKYAEGEITATEYADTLRQRRAWRAQINVLEDQLKQIKRG